MCVWIHKQTFRSEMRCWTVFVLWVESALSSLFPIHCGYTHHSHMRWERHSWEGVWHSEGIWSRRSAIVCSLHLWPLLAFEKAGLQTALKAFKFPQMKPMCSCFSCPLFHTELCGLEWYTTTAIWKCGTCLEVEIMLAKDLPEIHLMSPNVIYLLSNTVHHIVIMKILFWTLKPKAVLLISLWWCHRYQYWMK